MWPDMGDGTESRKKDIPSWWEIILWVVVALSFLCLASGTAYLLARFV